MNADLQMADELKNTGKDNLFGIFGEPGIDILDDADGKLTERLVAAGAMPKRTVLDAPRFAIAAANGVEYLVTWNFRQIADAMTRMQIKSIRRRADVVSLVICSPDELMEDINDEE